MPKETTLTSGFASDEANRIDSCLQKLLPHLKEDQITLVGGLAIRYLLTKAGIDYPNREFNDLDLMAQSASVVLPTVAQDFLIYHYHPQIKDNFYIVLVDPETKIKIDIFDNNPVALETVVVPYQGRELRLRSIEDQLTKTVFDIQRISKEKKVDPKQFSDTKLLSSVADMEVADRIWKQRGYTEYPDSIAEAIGRAEEIAKNHPDWVQAKPFRRPKPYKCDDCQDTLGFHVTPMEQIYQILGYIE